MHTNQQPARRATRQPGSDKPKIYHTIHHREPNGTIHTLCGQQRPASAGTKAALKTHTVPCILCDAARIIMGVRP